MEPPAPPPPRESPGLAYHNRAQELIAAGQPQDALLVLNEGLRISPDDPTLLEDRAAIFTRMGRHSQAASDRARIRGQQGGAAYVYGSFWQRFGAYLIDGFIAAIIAVVPAVVIGLVVYELALPEGGFVSDQEKQDAEDIAVGAGYLIAFVIGVGYLWIGNSLGGTWGKRALGLRVISVDDGANIGLGRGALRLFIYYIGALLFYIGWLWMIWDDNKQGWHDMVASSIVVRST